MEEFGETYNPAYLTGEYSDDDAEVGAEVVLDEDGNLCDIRVFDPYKRVPNGVYINPDGWSNWLYSYEDPDGNDIDTILENQE